MLCKTCGAQIPDDALECEFCGAETDNDVMTDETTVIDSEEVERQHNEDLSDETLAAAGNEIFDENEKKRQEQMQKMMENKKIQLSEIERRRNEKRQRQKRNKIMLISLICAVAVAAAGIGVYYVAQNVASVNTVQTTPMPTVSATLAAVPSASPSVSPMPTAGATVAPYTETSGTNTASTSGSSNTQSWTSTGNTSSGSSSSGSNNTASSTANSGSSSASSSNSGTSSSSSGASSGSNASAVANAVNSGISQDKISAQLSVGGEVIHNTGTGKYLMTFVTGGKKYYAHVSEGSTTEQIKNKTYTVTANPTGETYNGNTVYEITALTNYEGDYILPTSGTKLLTNADIKGMSKYDLALARNEIYARHGRKFQTAEYSKYFNGKSWYSINPNYNYSDDNANLNEIETKNVNFLLDAERK